MKLTDDELAIVNAMLDGHVLLVEGVQPFLKFRGDRISMSMIGLQRLQKRKYLERDFGKRPEYPFAGYWKLTPLAIRRMKARKQKGGA